jgi:outer membrane protein
MNKIATWLSILSLVLVGLLYYFHFTHVDFSKLKFNSKRVDTSAATKAQFKLAYFEMDSVDNNYEYVKFIREALRKKEADLNLQLNRLKSGYQKKISEWQKKGSNISQAESEAMNREYQQMQVNFESRQKQLNDEYESEKYKMYVDANKRIADFLKEFNKDKGFTYIIADQPNLIYYKDTVYNITQELIEGLNNLYKQDKRKN